jgi:hypothetical protein
MIHTAIRRGTLLVVAVVLSTGCGSSTPVAPTAITQPPVAAVRPPAPNFPPPSGPSRTFTVDHPLAPRVLDYTRQSQFVLYDNGAFALQYPSSIGDYRGGYTESNGVITFEWEGWSIAGPWSATGTINDGVLTMRYNSIMQLTDFEDAAYRLTQ